MKRRHLPFAIPTLLATLALTNPVWAAQPVAITNPGFEDPVLSNGSTGALPAPWLALNGGTIQILNPDSGSEWFVGGDPTNGSDDADKAPTFGNGDPNIYVFAYLRRDAANADPHTSIAVQYGTDLGGWTTATHGINGVSIDDTAVPSAGFRTVVASIPRALAGPGGRLFARLNVVVAP